MSTEKIFPDRFYWGETVRVRSDSMSLRKTFSEIFDFEKVDSLCKRTVARPCLIFLEVTNGNIDFQASEQHANGPIDWTISMLERAQKESFAYKVYSICKMQQNQYETIS